MFGLANPRKFMGFSAIVLPWAIGLTVIFFAAGLWWSLVVAPPDYQQGETVRIMYIHVPTASMSLLVYTFMVIASIVSLIWRHSLADVAAKVAAPIGAVFTALALITGSLWGKPMWGTWWEWDARLTSMLVLFFMYLGYMALWAMIEDPIKAARAAAILAIVGFINIPIIKFSVDWWNTLHQPASLFRADGPAIHSSMLTPLLIMIVAFNLLFLVLQLASMRAEITRQHVRAIQLAQAEG
ncbi:Cytochrome c-type biogenesis protein CcmC, putative heme lyase for CcmE [hydrothermal vent metagenome]|uniref:Cytochrome c-type biogenesis protein CcmC, putative heme lyase for CcmE n=1 Tax=hydrothermal vent metagenome TaxID=652676 RepID=A0A3B0SYM9_9ZZZZ